MPFERKHYKAGDYLTGGTYPAFVKGITPDPPRAPRFGDRLELPSLAEIRERQQRAFEQLETLRRTLKRR